jgi:iron complex outermembrane receptor protein
MAYAVPFGESLHVTTQFSSAVVRAAGPVITLPGGPTHGDAAGRGAARAHARVPLCLDGSGRRPSLVTPDRTQLVRSGYAELRAPVLARDFGFAPARGLELQLALRRDEVRRPFPTPS